MIDNKKKGGGIDEWMPLGIDSTLLIWIIMITVPGYIITGQHQPPEI